MENAIIEKKKAKGKKMSPFFRNLLIAIGLVAFVVVFLLSYTVFRPNNKTERHDFFEIKMMQELTTLVCRYHNVAVIDQEGNFLGVGKKYVWLEFDGVVEVGIDVGGAKIQQPSDDGVVKIFLPEAKVLSGDPDKTSIKKYAHDIGPLTDLTADEEMKAINTAIVKMTEAASTQRAITEQAHMRAKNIIEQYITNAGKLIGENYTVVWVDDPNEIQTVPAE